MFGRTRKLATLLAVALVMGAGTRCPAPPLPHDSPWRQVIPIPPGVINPFPPSARPMTDTTHYIVLLQGREAINRQRSADR